MSNQLSSFVDYLEAARIPMRLACKTESGWPVVLSLWYLYKEDKIFCATQKSARVISYLKANPKVAYEIAADTPPYCGVRGQAVATLDEQQGKDILIALLNRYTGGTDNPLAQKLLENSDNEIAIILNPVNSFNWDFSSRMHSIAPRMADLAKKICP